MLNWLIAFTERGLSPMGCCFLVIANVAVPLRECEADEDLTKLVVDIKGADEGAAALLIECRGEDADALKVLLRNLLGAVAPAITCSTWPMLSLILNVLANFFHAILMKCVWLAGLQAQFSRCWLLVAGMRLAV